MVEHDDEEQARLNEAVDSDSVAEGIDLMLQVLRALSPENVEDRAYQNSIESQVPGAGE